MESSPPLIDDSKDRKYFNNIVKLFEEKPQESICCNRCDRGLLPFLQRVPEEEHDGICEERMINVRKLKTVISRIEANDNPFREFVNLFPAFKTQFQPSEENPIQTLCQSLDEVFDENKDGNLTFTEYQNCLHKTCKVDSSPEFHVQKYIRAIAEGKKIYLWPPPFFIPSLTILQIFFFILHYGGGVLINRHLQFNTNRSQEAWRYVTYCLAHKDTQHLVFTLGLQLAVGLPQEMVHGTPRILGLYLLGVVTSALAFFCFDSNVLLGASGGVYCLIGASVCTTILNWRESKIVLVSRFHNQCHKPPHACSGRMLRLLKLLLIIAFATTDTGLAAHRRISCTPGDVSVIAHAFGACAGTLAGFLILRDQEEKPWEMVLKVISGGIFMIIVLVLLIINIAGIRGAVGLFEKTC